MEIATGTDNTQSGFQYLEGLATWQRKSVRDSFNESSRRGSNLPQNQAWEENAYMGPSQEAQYTQTSYEPQFSVKDSENPRGTLRQENAFQSSNRRFEVGEPSVSRILEPVRYEEDSQVQNLVTSRSMRKSLDTTEGAYLNRKISREAWDYAQENAQQGRNFRDLQTKKETQVSPKKETQESEHEDHELKDIENYRPDAEQILPERSSSEFGARNQEDLENQDEPKEHFNSKKADFAYEKPNQKDRIFELEQLRKVVNSETESEFSDDMSLSQCSSKLASIKTGKPKSISGQEEERIQPITRRVDKNFEVEDEIEDKIEILPETRRLSNTDDPEIRHEKRVSEGVKSEDMQSAQGRENLSEKSASLRSAIGRDEDISESTYSSSESEENTYTSNSGQKRQIHPDFQGPSILTRSYERNVPRDSLSDISSEEDEILKQGAMLEEDKTLKYEVTSKRQRDENLHNIEDSQDSQESNSGQEENSDESRKSFLGKSKPSDLEREDASNSEKEEASHSSQQSQDHEISGGVSNRNLNTEIQSKDEIKERPNQRSSSDSEHNVKDGLEEERRKSTQNLLDQDQR